MVVRECWKKKAFGRVRETDRSYQSKQNNSGSKSHPGKRRRNTERKRDGTTRTLPQRNEDQSQYQSTTTERRCENQKRGQCKCWG